MNIQTILSYLEANGIDFNKEFVRIENEKFIAEYEETVNLALSKISKYITFGLNNGFSEELQQGIKNTIDVIVKICKEKDTKKHATFNKTLRDIDVELSKKTMKNDNADGDNILTKLLVFVDKYTLAISAIKQNPDTARTQILEEILVKLSYLKNNLSYVLDVSSEKALAHAKKILSLLNKMRDAVSTSTHDERTYAFLDEALEESTLWAEERVGVIITKTFFKTTSNKANDLSALNFKENSLTKILEGRDALKTLSLIRENIDNYKKIIDRKFSFQSEQEKIMQTQKEIADMEKSLLDLTVSYKNGEMLPSIYTAMVGSWQSQIAIKKEQLLLLSKDIQSTISKYTLNYRVYAKLNRTIAFIENFADEPELLDFLVSQINVASLTRVMNGSGNDQDIASLLNITFITDSVDKKTHQRLQEFLKKQDEQEKILAGNQTEKISIVDPIVNPEEEKAEADKLAEQILGKKPVVDNSVQPDTEEQPFIFNDIKDEN